MTEETGINYLELETEIRSNLNSFSSKDVSIKDILKKMTEYYGTSSFEPKHLLIGRITKKDRDSNGYGYYEVQPLDYQSGSVRKAFLTKNPFVYRLYEETPLEVNDLCYLTFELKSKYNNPKIETDSHTVTEEQRESDIERILNAKAERFAKINEKYQSEYDKAREFLTAADSENLADKVNQTRETLMDIDSLKDSVDETLTKYEHINSIRPEIEELIARYDEKLDEISKLEGAQKEKAIERLAAETGALDFDSTAVVIDQVSGYIDSCGFVYNSKERVVRRFVSALLTDQLIILSGPPGTGKTSLPQLVARAIGAEFTKISVQSNWTDAQDLIGFYDYRENKYVSTSFLDALIDARDDQERIHIILLDEMNIARIEYYFSMFLSSMDRLEDDDERKITLFAGQDEIETTSGRKVSPVFVIPDNVQFVGTVNMDETTNKPSPKVLNRSYVIEIMPAEEEKKKGINMTGVGGTKQGRLGPIKKEEPETKDYSPVLINPDAFRSVRDQGSASSKDIDDAVKALGTHYGVSYSSRNRKNAETMLRAGANADDIVIGSILPGLYEKDAPEEGTAELPDVLANSKEKLKKMTASLDIDYWRY